MRKCWELIGKNALEKVSWAKKFEKIVFGPKGAKIAAALTKRA